MNSTAKKNFIWNAIGLTFNCFNSLFFLIIARRINGMSDAGIFSYSFSLCVLFYFISVYYNRPYQIANANKTSFNQFFTTRLMTSLFTIVFTILFCLINRFELYKSSIIMALMFFRTSDAISDCIYAYLQQKDKLYLMGISLTLRSILCLIGFIVIDIVSKNLLLSVITITILNAIISIFYDLRYFRKVSKNYKIKLDFSKYKNILLSTLPIFLFSFLQIYLANCQKYIITYFEPNEMQTIFGIIIMPATMLSLVGSYLINPFINDLDKNFKKNKKKEFTNIANKILIALAISGLLVLGVCYIVGIPLLNFIYNVKLFKFKLDFVIIILASIFAAASMVISNIMTITNKNKEQLYIYIATSIFATILSVILEIKFSLFGASLAYLIAYLFILLLFIILYRKTIKEWKEK